MSTEVSEAAVDEVGGALNRNLASYTSQQWVETATALVRSGGNQAAAQLAPGETVEWLTPGIVHRYGKVWPEAILLVTPHRLIISASRGTIRTKREISSLYRGPESLLSVSNRLLPGTNADHWVLEIATQQGPFLFAVPNFVGAESLAQITATFVTGRARYAPETGTLVDGEPWGAPQASAPAAAFEAARADLAPVTEAPEPAEADLGGPPTEAFSWPEIPEQRSENDSLQAAAVEPAQQFWSPFEPAEPPAAADPDPTPFVTPPEFAPPTEAYTPPVVLELTPEPEPEPQPEPEQQFSWRDEPAALPAPDWYPDPLGEAGLRYWDGQAWTHSTAS